METTPPNPSSSRDTSPSSTQLPQQPGSTEKKEKDDDDDGDDHPSSIILAESKDQFVMDQVCNDWGFFLFFLLCMIVMAETKDIRYRVVICVFFMLMENIWLCA